MGVEQGKRKTGNELILFCVVAVQWRWSPQIQPIDSSWCQPWSVSQVRTDADGSVLSSVVSARVRARIGPFPQAAHSMSATSSCGWHWTQCRRSTSWPG
jgi:hypothetical protein